jgi:hypothetical protein
VRKILTDCAKFATLIIEFGEASGLFSDSAKRALLINKTAC